MGLRQCAFAHFANAVGEEAQRALRGDARIQLPQRAGRAIARVGQYLAALGTHLRVVGFERSTWHVDLAAHFQHPRPTLAAQTQRNRFDGAQVGADILAGGAIAARGALHELAIFVAQADRQAIEFGFGRKQRLSDLQPLADAPHELGHFLIAEGIAQRQHRHGMPHFGKPRGGQMADALGWRIGAGQFRVRALQGLKLAHQLVVIGIGHLRLVEYVIPVVGVFDSTAQGIDALSGIRAGSHTIAGLALGRPF